MAPMNLGYVVEELIDVLALDGWVSYYDPAGAMSRTFR